MVLATVSVGCIGSQVVGAPRLPVPAGQAGPLTAPDRVPVPAAPRPTELRIPAIEVRTTITPLGLQDDGTVEVPADPEEVGWYRLGPTPGQPGSAAILGHVDSTTGPAVFYRLRSLPRGARIDVGRSDGSTATFIVRTIRTYPNAEFPATAVYRSTGRPSLTLVTCGGAYDRSRGGYQANVVVVAELADPAPGV